jgi:hypothetical protein
MSPITPGADQTTAERFGEVVTRLARLAGYDMDRGGTGRAQLAEQTGATVQTVGRWLKGEVLPGLTQYQHIARALGVEPIGLLREAGIIPHEDEHPGSNQPVPSRLHTPVDPATAADLLGVTHPTIRDMLIPSMEQAQRLQRDIDRHGTGGEAAVARG